MEDHFEPTTAEGAMPVGARLAAARKARKLELADISEQTRIPTRFLEMIEQGEHQGMPAPPYSIGFVRSFAQIVGLDPVATARDFRAELSVSRIERPMHTPFEPVDPARVPSRSLALIAVAAALLIALVYALWRVGVMDGDTADDRARLAAGTVLEESASAPAVPPPAATSGPAPAPPPAAPPAAGPVVLTAIEPVWVRIYEPGGERLVERTLGVGERYEVPATATDPMILTGRPQALRITVGTVAIAPLGPPERTIRDVSLKAPALLARNTEAQPGAQP